MKPPALGLRRVNSIRLLPVARIAIAASTNAHGAIEPIAITIAGMVRNTLSAGAMLASVLEVVPKRPTELAGSSVPDVAGEIAAVSFIAVYHLSVRYRQRHRGAADVGSRDREEVLVEHHDVGAQAGQQPPGHVLLVVDVRHSGREGVHGGVYGHRLFGHERLLALGAARPAQGAG